MALLSVSGKATLSTTTANTSSLESHQGLSACKYHNVFTSDVTVYDLCRSTLCDVVAIKRKCASGTALNCHKTARVDIERRAGWGINIMKLLLRVNTTATAYTNDTLITVML